MFPPPYNELIWPAGLHTRFPAAAQSQPGDHLESQLVLGGQQGVTDALVDIGVLPQSYYATTYPAINDLAKMTKIA